MLSKSGSLWLKLGHCVLRGATGRVGWESLTRHVNLNESSLELVEKYLLPLTEKVQTSAEAEQHWNSVCVRLGFVFAD